MRKTTSFGKFLCVIIVMHVLVAVFLYVGHRMRESQRDVPEDSGDSIQTLNERAEGDAPSASEGFDVDPQPGDQAVDTATDTDTVVGDTSSNAEESSGVTLDELSERRESDRGVLTHSERDDEIIHVVKKGESYWKIARKYDTTTKKLMDYNQVADNHVLKVGEKLKIPPSE